jgi:Mg-chelatase subunit ChlD
MKKIDKGNIGDYANNKILDWTPISFAIEFIYRMRRNKARLQNMPSTRQAIAIPKLITAIYYRKLNLIPDDFIRAAVITTPIEDQSIAQEIAFNIIFENKKDSKTEKQKNSLPMGSSDEKSDFMDELLDVFDTELDIGSLDTEELIEQAMEEFTGLMDFVDDLYNHADLNDEPYKSLIDIIEQRSDYKYILEQGIRDLKTLKNNCHQSILRDINDLSPKDIESAINLDWGEDILEQSKTPWITLTAQYLMNDSQFKTSLQNVMINSEVGASARALNYLKDVGMQIKDIENLANQLVDRVDNIMDLYEISDVLNYIPPFNHDKVISNSLNKDPYTSFDISRGLDNKFDSNLTNELFKQWAKHKPSPSLSELYQAQTDVPEWSNMLDQYVNQQVNDFLNNNGHASYDLADLAIELMNLSTEAKFASCYDSFIENAKKVGMKALNATHEKEQFKNVLKSMVSSVVPIDQSKAVIIGKALGIKEETIIEIFGGNYKLLKAMYEQNLGNFERFTKIIEKIKLNAVQMDELMQLAYKSNNYQGMGALSHYNMGTAFNSAGKIGKNAQRKVAESLSAGPGKNLLLQWFYHRNRVPSHLKDFIKNLCKDALIKIAMNIISNQRGSGEKGLIPTTQLRPFIIGDDIDLIDIDATIENIIMQGKSADMITSEDLLVNRTEKGRVSICFLLDISGSMGGLKLAACSIAVMVLIGSLRADEVAICFFESNTHIVKEFGDTRDLENVANELLDLKARGGTQVQAALEWGAKELEKTRTERKICFLLTDYQFAESEEMIKKELEEYVNQRVQFLLGVNTRSYSKNYAKWILETTQGEIVHIMNIMEIPQLVTEMLEKLG